MTERETAVIDKVLKLLAKAESTTPEEAEALTAKAEALMMRWAIDDAMLAAAQGRQVDSIGSRRFTFVGSYAEPQRQLCFAIANAFGFRCTQHNGYGGRRVGSWFGWEADLTKAEHLLASLLVQQTRAQKAFIKPWREANRDLCEYDRGARYRTEREFALSFACEIGRRLKKVRRMAVEEAETETVASTFGSVALVLVSRQKRLDEWYDERYGHLRSARGSNLRGGYGGWNEGREAAARADLGQPGVAGSRGALNR